MTRSGNTLVFFLATLLSACRTPSESTARTSVPPVALLDGVRSWAMQLQGVDDSPRGVRRLTDARVDLLVIEPTRSVDGRADFDARSVVSAVQASEGPACAHKRCVAYLNIGQAEDYRAYWKDDWVAPTESAPGSPSFLLTVDPDGWSGNYPVAYWDPRWQRTLFGGPDAPLDQILEDGFDGVYLDWILGCVEPAVVAAAEAAAIDPLDAMVELVASVRAYGRARNPLFVVIAQNGIDLVEQRPELVDVLDGFAHEDLSFSGSAAASWHDAESGDHPAPEQGPWSTADLGAALARIRSRGIPVFTIDYAVRDENAARATETARMLGFVPFVSRAPLDRLPARVFAAPR